MTMGRRGGADADSGEAEAAARVAGSSGLLTSLQRRFLYFPARGFIASPRDQGFEHEDVHLVAGDGVPIHAWWLPVGGASRTVLFLHGNAGNVSYWLDVAATFRDVGWNTLLIDYRGYGKSQGTPTEIGTYLDARAAWRHLVLDRGIDADRLVIAGRSLGGGVATWLALEQECAGLVLEATFTSIADVVSDSLPLPGIGRLVRLGYESLARIPRISVPLLVVHGRQDELVPFAHGRRLHQAARDPKQFVELAGGHNDAFSLDRATYLEGLRKFARMLDEYTRARQTM